MKKAFTLIELLIVVAIIAILAAIAVPNFLEAQVRAKVARAQNDMRTLATGIEAYTVDHNRPITCYVVGTNSTAGVSLFTGETGAVSPRFIRLTTPIAYLTSVFRDPFVLSKTTNTGSGADTYDTYDYVDAVSLEANRGSGATCGAAWRLCSAGPDTIMAYGGSYVGNTFRLVAGGPLVKTVTYGMDYDATNGTKSNGDIVRIGGGPGVKGLVATQNVPAIDRIQNKINETP